MITIFHKSAYAWSLNDYRKSFEILDEYLKSALQEDVFSIDDGFFDNTTASYLPFLERLTSNSNRRNSFCATFSALWNDFPSYSVLRLLLIKDFSEPSMIKAFGMEDYGFEEPEEDFEQILEAFRKSAHQGFLTHLQGLGPFNGRVYLDFEHLNESLYDDKWMHYKKALLNFEKELKYIEPLSWDKILASNHQLLLSTFLHQIFGEFNRNPYDNWISTTGCLQMNPTWKDAIAGSIEIILQDYNDNELSELVNATCQIQLNKLSGRNWLRTYLDYTIDFKQKTFFKLY